MASDGPLPDNVLGQFANTFKEWHYFVGGFCIGFVAGFIAGVEYARRVIE